MHAKMTRASRIAWRFCAAVLIAGGMALAPFATMPAIAAVNYQNFPVSVSGTAPTDLVMGPGGDGASADVWFTDAGTNQIGRMTYTGIDTAYAIPTANANPTAITVGSDGALWFTERDAAKIGRITTDGVFTEYALASGSTPTDISGTVSGDLWFTDPAHNTVNRISTMGSVTSYVVPTENAEPYGIDVSYWDGQVWFTEAAAGAAAVATITDDGVIQEKLLQNPNSRPVAIVSATNIAGWVIERDNAAIGIFEQQDVGEQISVDDVRLPSANAIPVNGILGPDWSLWFTETIDGVGYLGYMDNTYAQNYWELPLGAGTNPTGVAWGPLGGIWVAQSGTGYISSFKPEGISYGGDREFIVNAGEYFSYTFAGGGNPTPVIAFTSGQLPEGMSLVANADGTATLSGTPAEGSEGMYLFMLTYTSPFESPWELEVPVMVR